MNQEIKNKTISFGELKNIKITVSRKYIEELLRTRVNGDNVEIHLKDIVNKIYATRTKR